MVASLSLSLSKNEQMGGTAVVERTDVSDSSCSEMDNVAGEREASSPR